MKTRSQGWVLVGTFVWVLLSFSTVVQAQAAEEPPYEFDAQLSLTGGCGTSKPDPAPDPGCPEKKPPKALTSPRAIAIDSFGDEYVASFGAEEGKQGRIDVFSPAGVFITEVFDGHGPKSVAVDGSGNLYVFDSQPTSEIVRYSPTEYKPEEGKIKYGSTPQVILSKGPLGFEGGVAVDASNDHLFVDAKESILEYSSAAEGSKLENTITSERLHSSNFLAVDAQRRRLYASSCPNGDITKCWVLVFNADKPNEVLKEIEGPNPPEEIFLSTKGWISVAVDEETGNFFVGDLEVTKDIYQFNSKYELVSTLKQDPALFEGGEAMQVAISNAPEGVKNHRYLFVPSLKNRALAYSPPKEQIPAFVALEVTGISEEEAELLATIKPRGGTTAYRFEYLSEEEWEEAGETFAGAKVASEGTILPSESEAEVGAAIAGLSPGIAYRARLVAENGAGSEAREITFTTYSDAPIATECPEAIRSTYSTLLPDCRAYELVTPANTNGRPPKGVGFAGDQFPTLEASASGEALSFLTEGGVIPGLGGTGSLNGDLYHVARSKEGWQTTSAGPTGAETISANPGSTSSDQGYSFWVATREGSAVIEGEATHYVRYPDGHSALVGRGSLGTDPRAQGSLITEGGSHIVFQTGDQPVQLEKAAPPPGTAAVYDRTPDESTHVVSLLPGNKTPETGESAGYRGASPDGSGIAFEVVKGKNAGKLYLRVNNDTTYEIGSGLEVASISEGGSRIFYMQGGNLIAFDVATEKTIPFTVTGDAVPVNVSTDGSHAYFISATAIEGAGENPNGASAKAGQENLYLSEEGQSRFVATVTKRDVVGEPNKNKIQFDGLGLWTSAVSTGELARDPSRTSPDGSVLLFQSRADLDGYAHEGVPEIYRYDSAAARLHCISCLPTRTAATTGSSLQSFAPHSGTPEPSSAFGFVQSLRADGKRAIFQSTEALVSRDGDGVQDVYEWEEQGQGSCTRAGGCVYLISSGKSATDNYLYGISASGNDVFFTTSDVLAGGDDSTVSIYDARVNGGFPEQVEKPCKGEGCRPVLSPPPPIIHSESGVRSESGNLPPPKHCPKGKHKATRNGKQVCVKNHKHHKKHHAKKKGRAGK